MPKSKSKYICQNCEYESAKWLGQCPNCNEWNTLEEKIYSKNISLNSKKISVGTSVDLVPLSKVVSKNPKRISSEIQEFDRVVGGGFVPGQVILLVGEPGIGKSTLLTQLAENLGSKKVIYVSGEESLEQIKVRASRLNYAAKNLYMLPETDVSTVTATLEEHKDAGLIIVDSIQTLYSSEFSGFKGSISQLKGCTQILIEYAKNASIPVILVGHVTKEGALAGPKILEHMVDTVLYLEGDNQHMYRILKTSKNRFGPVSEVGIFEMGEKGLIEVKNPSEMFLSQRLVGAAGSCITVLMEGFRPILFEIQALTSKTSFGYPVRTTNGFNVNRLKLLIAILENRCGVNLSNHDVYVNVAGGLKISEYAADLAVCLAIVSAIKNKPLDSKLVAFGECGLSGELRNVSYIENRIKEAKNLGYKNIVSGKEFRSLNKVVKSLFAARKNT